MTDWGRGTYEHTAKELAPVSVSVCEAIGIGAGDRVLDVACGTGNAALAAAARGATVAGVDRSERLVGVAHGRAVEAGVDAEWHVADATALPFEDDTFDVAVSIFGVIFAQPAEDAVAELARVVRPGGRIAITSWVPAGPLFVLGRLLREAAEQVSPTDGPPPPAWGDPAVARQLLSACGATVEVTEHALTFEAASPRALADANFDHHPVWLNVRDMVGEGLYAQLRARSVQILEDLNEDGDRFRGTSRYLLSVATLPGG